MIIITEGLLIIFTIILTENKHVAVSFGIPDSNIQNDQPTSSSPAQVYDLVQMLRERMTSNSQRFGGYDGIQETVGMCQNRPNNKKDVAYKISQRAIASIPTASVKP